MVAGGHPTRHRSAQLPSSREIVQRQHFTLRATLGPASHHDLTKLRSPQPAAAPGSSTSAIASKGSEVARCRRCHMRHMFRVT